MILALDIGTSSVRAALYDSAGNRLDATFVKNERTLEFTGEGGAEVDAETGLKQVEQAIDEVLAKAGAAADRIEFVAASCFWHSLVGVDESGEALTPVLTWADRRSADFVPVLQEKFDENETHNRTGCRFHPSYWTAKLLWFKDREPDVFGKAVKWLSFSDFLALRFFGEAATSVSQASGTGIFNIRECVWDSELTGFLNLSPDNLPRVASDAETFVLNEKYAARWQQLKNAKWFPGIGDGAANNVGANCARREKAALMIGTSGAMRVIYEGDPPADLPPGLWCYRLDRKRVIVGGALSDGGGLYGWLKNSFQYAGTDDELETKIAAMTPDSHGLTVLPFWSGERSTNWNAKASGAILGLTPHTSPIQIMQAVLEGVAYRFAAIFEQLCAGVCPLEEIIASGGALRESPVWTQIIADALGKTLTLPDTREASSRGAVLLVLETTGKIENIAELKTDEGQIFTPDAAKHEIYKLAKRRQEDLYASVMKTKA
ncbi:MAG TPA: gluconokinase [Pyrinomonadaceae bacterium]|nr:gluconokinase [Pyrinomonadaceae bacterium]